MKRLLFAALALAMAAGSSLAQAPKPPGMPYFKLEAGVEKSDPDFKWWFEIPPAPEYELWWQEIAACEKLPLPPQHKDVRWFVVNAPDFVAAREPTDTTETTENLWAVGYAWRSSPPEIWLALRLHALETLVKHEMLHLLMFWAGEPPGHPPERFTVCGLSISYDPATVTISTR